MSFWDRIKRWLSGEEEPTRASAGPSVMPIPGIGPVLDASTGNVLSAGDKPLGVPPLIFSNKDKHTTVMLNSISLSSDMTSLYLIDNGRVITFDLTVPQGVLVGLLGDQLVVATGRRKLTPEDGPAVTIDSESTELEKGTAQTEGKVHTFKAGEDSQYTLSYNGKNKALGIIGTGDIILNLETHEDGDCGQVFTSLDNQTVVRIKRNEDELIIEEISGH